MSIKPLKQSTIKKLTSEQVITSVYSVVKELVENGLDSGANAIEVILHEKGLSTIEVRDNGSGISDIDTPFMALPGYTSKLSNFNDLDSLQTYGFRGEALNALCKVASVKIITRTNQDDVARCCILDPDGRIVKVEPTHRSTGTTVHAAGLFEQYPVRRQFISNNKQASQNVQMIESLLKDYGVCCPESRISFIADNSILFSKNSKNTYKESLLEVFNKKIMANYEFLEYNNDTMNIILTVPKKDLSNLSDITDVNYSHIFINKRPVIFKDLKDPIIDLISQNFSTKFSRRKKPLFFLNVTLPPSEVDVNLEPNKSEVFLKNKLFVIEPVKELLINYYNIERADSECKENSSNLESTVMNSSFNESFQDSQPGSQDVPNKKRKVQLKNLNKISLKNKRPKTDEAEEKNQVNIDNVDKVFNVPQARSSSPLPEVDLGEDFNSQQIRDIPVLGQNDIGNIMSKMISKNNGISETKKLNSDKSSPNRNFGTSEVDEEFDKLLELEKSLNDSNTENNIKAPAVITESQWSEGHLPNLKGGVDVIIGQPNVTPVKKKANKTNKVSSNSSSTNSAGFSKFCQLARERILEKNPNIDSVQLAIQISKEWKYLDSEERQYFRDLGKKDKSLSESNSSVNKSHRSRLAPTELRERNKKRLLDLLDNACKKKPVNANTANNDCEQNQKTIISWDVDMVQIRDSAFINFQNVDNNIGYRVIGHLSQDIWLVTANSHLWMLNSGQLIDELTMTEIDEPVNKDNAECIQSLLTRWMRENDDMTLLHPLHAMY